MTDMRAKIIMAAWMTAAALTATAQRNQQPWVTPALPGTQPVLRVESPELLRQPAGATVSLQEGVQVAKTPPQVLFAFCPGQTYRGKPWSNWSDGCVLNGRYYSAISDHLSPRGSARIIEFDPASGSVRIVVDIGDFLEKENLLAPGERYTPGKIHSRVQAGRDGWLYYSTHRGSPRDASDAVGYRGDWIFRTWPDPVQARTEVVVAYPITKHSLPASTLDPDRMIFYAGSAAGPDAADQGILFAAVDTSNRQTVCTAPDGFDRYAIFARSTGRVYWGTRERTETPARGFRYDPATRKITACPSVPHVRACTDETAGGLIYGVSGTDCQLWAFDTRKETLAKIGEGAVGGNSYVTSIDIDPTGRYLYYVPGAHGGGPREGTPVVQFDLKTKTRKVICFMNVLEKGAGASFEGTFSTALSEAGDTLFVTWNLGRPKWDCCGVTAIRIPESEREP
jgi:hypothetical protein